MRGKNDGFGTMVDGIFNGRDGTGYSLGVCDFLVGIEGDVEIDLRNELVGEGGEWEMSHVLVL